MNAFSRTNCHLNYFLRNSLVWAISIKQAFSAVAIQLANKWMRKWVWSEWTKVVVNSTFITYFISSRVFRETGRIKLIAWKLTSLNKTRPVRTVNICCDIFAWHLTPTCRYRFRRFQTLLHQAFLHPLNLFIRHC